MFINCKNTISENDKISTKEIINFILKKRKIGEIEVFLNPKSPQEININDFGFKSDIKKTIALLKKVKREEKSIVIYTDYDADGITAGAILWETLYLLGFKAWPYVPNRHFEGYGFSIKGINNIKKQFDPALIISVDHGITKVKEVDYAKKLGIEIVVTDHHLKQEKTPKAHAIFHIPSLSGSGVSYFFSKMVFKNFAKPKDPNYQLLTTYYSGDYLSLATIGTIADLVPLIGPSRSIVKYGLNAFSQVKRHGLKHILKEAGIADKTITPYEIGFIVAPRINAVGRLGHAIDALRLLCTTDEKRAHKLAEHLGATNRLRQDELEKSLKEATEMLMKSLSAKRPDLKTPTCVDEIVPEKNYIALGGFSKTDASDQKLLPKIIVLVSDHWNEGIIGLIASKIADQFYRPTLVLTKNNGFYKGSARSISGFDITGFLRLFKDEDLVDVGGHKQAAGFTIKESKLHHFVTAVEKWSKENIKDKDLERKIEVDLKIPVSKVNLQLVKELEKLAPFGIGNPQPTFLSQGRLTDAQIFGKKQEHLKLFMGGIEFISFYGADQFTALSRNQNIKLIYRASIDRWGEKERLRGILIECINN